MPSEPFIPGPVRDEIANGIVQIFREYIGRGPRSISVHAVENLVVVVAEDVYTVAEHSLIAADREDTVLDLRQGFQEAMREAITGLVATHANREVDAFMSANHIEPDMSVEIVVLK